MGVKAIQAGIPAFIPEQFDTLAKMLLYMENHHPQRGITYVDTSGNEQFESYAELAVQARVYLQQLRNQGIQPGDMLILELDQPREFYKALWACFLGGMIAAPVSQPTSWEPNTPGLLKFSRVWEVLGKPIVIIEEAVRARYEKLKQTDTFAELQYISTAQLQDEQMLEAEVYDSKPHDVVFLQFSSGSTGIPKGVQLTNYNILANNYATKVGLGAEEGDTVFTWLPHTHDMGLFGQHLLPMYCASNIVQFLPYSFIRSPYLFLKKITEHGGKWFCCTNFGFDWMVQKVPDDKLDTLDLSSLRITLNGAEPISTKVIDRFVEKFSRCGYRAEMMFPAYGMAEATVGVSSSTVGQAPVVERLSRQQLLQQQIDRNVSDLDSEQIAEFVREGSPMPGIEIRIADEQGDVLDESMIGEIQIRGASVTKGYYNMPETNERLFIDGWLRTGDLGYMIDGALVVTGRMKDIIFVRGLNFYAHDLEEVLYDTELIPRGNLAVTGHFNTISQEEEVLVFVKYKGDAERFYPIKEALEQQLQATLGIGATHVLPIKAIPKTTSGKVQRFMLQASYEQGEFDEEISKLAAYSAKLQQQRRNVTAPRNEQEAVLLGIWAEVLQLPQQDISVDDSFMSLGGQSIKAYQLLELVSRHYQYEFGAELLVFCKSIEEMAHYIERLNVQQPKQKQSVEDMDMTAQPLDIHRAAAVTGLALRVPNADSKEQFWHNLVNKVDSIVQVSDKRKQLAQHSEWNDPIGELDDIDSFDYSFFEMEQDEAKYIDPQHRIAYEVSYEALEEAGVISSTEEPQRIGVYAAINPSSYMNLLVQQLSKQGTAHIHPNAMVGNMSNIVAARIAHLYNFTGPALAIDTACSSFLVALHYAFQAVRNQEVDGAVVIGANVNVTPEVHRLSGNAGICSSTSHTKVFDKDADGSIIGEGVVVVYIEPLTQAVKGNKHIHGVIRGSAINNDGYSLGIMAPNPKGQYEVLKAAYSDAKVAPQQVSYVEAHGSGTTIGDPIEINALNKWFGKQGSKGDAAIGIGSVKSNIGHLFPASSGASLAKVLLNMQHKQLVPSLHVKQINPALQLEKTPFYIVDQTRQWEVGGNAARIAGISSFGLGGTNAHLVVEEWQAQPLTGSKRTVELITFSAKSQASLTRLMERTMHAVQGQAVWSVADIAFTRNTARKHHAYRAACLAVRDENGQYEWQPFAYGAASANRSLQKVYIITGMGAKAADIEREPVEVASVQLAQPQTAQMQHARAQVAAASSAQRPALEKLGESHAHKSADMHEVEALLHSIQASLSEPPRVIDLGSERYTAKHNGQSSSADSSLLERLMESKRSDVVIAIGLSQQEQQRLAGTAHLVFNYNEAAQLSTEQANLELLKQLYVHGVALNWKQLYPHGSGKLLPLPGYSFDKQRCWITD